MAIHLDFRNQCSTFKDASTVFFFELFIFFFLTNMRHSSSPHNPSFNSRSRSRSTAPCSAFGGLRFDSRTELLPPRCQPSAHPSSDLPRAAHPSDVGPASSGKLPRPGSCPCDVVCCLPPQASNSGSPAKKRVMLDAQVTRNKSYPTLQHYS